MADDKPNFSKAELFAYRRRNIIPGPMFRTHSEVLGNAGNPMEARGNKIALFFGESYLSIIVSGAPSVSEAFKKVGFELMPYRSCERTA